MEYLLVSVITTHPNTSSHLLPHVLSFISPPDVVARVSGHILMALWRIVNCVIIYFCQGDHCVIAPQHTHTDTDTEHSMGTQPLPQWNMNFNYFNDFRLISEFEFEFCALQLI